MAGQPDAAAGEGLAAWIDPRRAALLVVDMQADFAARDGAMARAGADLTGLPAALAAAERLAAAARAAGAPVVFAVTETRPETDPQAWREWVRRRGGDPAVELAVCRAGSPGAALVGPAPLPGEPVVLKRRYSAFRDTDLDARLRGMGIDTLVVCGLTTECCVDAAARDAFDLGYHAFVVRDACAAYGAGLHAAALRALELNCAILTDSAAVLAAWRGGPAR